MLNLLESHIEKWTKYGVRFWIISLSCLKRFGNLPFHHVLGVGFGWVWWVWFGRFGLVGLVWWVWFGGVGLVVMQLNLT